MFNQPAKIEYAVFEENRRIIICSDIHGNLPYFKGLLDKVHFCNEDILVIDGDFLEKGSYSLETLRYIMALSESGNVYTILGNCDEWHLVFQWGENGNEHLHHYFTHKKYGLLYEMLTVCGIDPLTCRFSDHMSLLKERFASEWLFLSSLPHALVTEKYVFAHAGIDGSKPIDENSSDDFTTRDAFLRENQCFDRWVISGHWPCVLYGENLVCANPIIDRDHHIISIDGGCVLKDDGQLNALIIPSYGSDEFTFEYYDPFPTAVVLDDQAESEKSYYIRWGDSTVRVLNRGDEFSRCRHIRTGYEMDILTKYLFTDCDETGCNDCTDYILPLKTGDIVSIIETTSRGYFVKHNGISGWYFGRLSV